MWLLAFFATTALAANSSMNIKTAELVPLDDSYALKADIDIKFSNEIEQAIIKGFDLNFLVEFQLFSPRKYWFDDEIVTMTREVALSYHALSRQYLLVQDGQQKTFVTLEEATDELSYISNLKMFKKSDVEKGGNYKAVLLVRLDYKKLPKALQVDALGLDEWKISSQRFEWTPNLFK